MSTLSCDKKLETGKLGSVEMDVGLIWLINSLGRMNLEGEYLILFLLDFGESESVMAIVLICYENVNFSISFF